VRSLGNDIRLAVDDAGAGVANFGHIVELGPDFVKLDNGLIRRVNGNLGRQALVVGMRHFARTAGCRLIAEWIETEAEARTLIQLGVKFGQGYGTGGPSPLRAAIDVAHCHGALAACRGSDASAARYACCGMGLVISFARESPSGRTSSPTRSRLTSATMMCPISVLTIVKIPRSCIRCVCAWLSSVGVR
jgi:hypothetical protein